ncbi:hypothetical protein SAY86_019844 [Trapa natans]|uniref:Uncharacterized protein n=1 Tax=Trapa natans TaxID=22666 RepID=A0AAN7R522_TRANT|nr:hypothetical protein SAY86_019844 [Trapa natans]
MAANLQAILKPCRGEVKDGHEVLTLEEEEEEEEEKQQTLNTKRQKSLCNHVISILHEDGDKLPHHGLWSLITTTVSPYAEVEPWSTAYLTTPEVIGQCDASPTVTEEGLDDRERVFRHLLEASDDELGLPSRDEGSSSSVFEPALFPVDTIDNMDDLSLKNLASLEGLYWELEDETANYNAILQSELFLGRDEL